MAEVLRVSLVMRRMRYAQIISVLGDVLALFAVIGVLTFTLHSSAPAVTGVQIAYLLPPAILGIVAGNFVIGFAVAGIVIPSQTLLQQETPPALLGRVGSTVLSVIFAAQISGLTLSGMVASRIGVRNVFVACAVLVAILIAVGRLWMEPKDAAATAV